MTSANLKPPGSRLSSQISSALPTIFAQNFARDSSIASQRGAFMRQTPQ
jgi:hypothetical protein